MEVTKEEIIVIFIKQGTINKYYTHNKGTKAGAASHELLTLK